MGCGTELESELDVLKRIVALLFGLADLAERAACRSYPIRCFVLWLLRRAEPVARCYVVGEWDADDVILPAGALPALTSVHPRNSPAEAMHLAATLRTLARALADQLRMARRFSIRCKRREAGAGETVTLELKPDARPATSPSRRAKSSDPQGPKPIVPARCASAERRSPQAGFT
jgi:hypothetical protein